MNNQLSIYRRRPFVWIALLLLTPPVIFLVASCNGGDSKSVPDESVVKVGKPLSPSIKESEVAPSSENIKALAARGANLAFIVNRVNEIVGAFTFEENGECVPCKFIGPTSDDGKPAYSNSQIPQQQGKNDVLPFPEAQAAPQPPCPHYNCGCTSGHCRVVGGHCCNC